MRITRVNRLNLPYYQKRDSNGGMYNRMKKKKEKI